MYGLEIAKKVKEYREAFNYYESLLKEITPNDEVEAEHIEKLYEELVNEYMNFLAGSTDL